MAQSKKLTLAAVKRHNSAVYGVRKQVDIAGHSFIVDTNFRPTKINDLVQEFITDLDYFRVKEINIDGLDMSGYVMLLIVKHFSDFDVPESPELKLQTLKLLIDGEYFIPMMNAFDEYELKRVSDKIEEFTNLMSEGLEKAKAEFEKQMAEEMDSEEEE